MRLAILLALLVAPLAQAEEVKIVLWNAEQLFNVGTVNSRSADLASFGQQFSDASIVILDEVTSLAVVNAARDKMGFTGFHTACSDFAQNDNANSNSLEVGIISKFPLDNVVEFDQSPDNTGQPEEPAEQELITFAGLPHVIAARGFLTADVPELGITLVATHLKSSVGVGAGAADLDNSQKRELVAAAMAKFVTDKRNANAQATVLVGGDLNVGETDKSKNGFRLGDDTFNAAAGDLYDDTHAIFSAGLIDNLHMASLTKGIGSETYDDPQFAGSGPIDCLYVAGRRTGDFTLAKKSSSTFGSDHFAVSVRFLYSGGMVQGRVRISALLPNPDGPDVGHEWVKLRNDGSAPVDLAGWKLRDEANNIANLTGTISPGTELMVTLAAGELPLNNSGDEVELLDNTGNQVDFVSYAGGQVASGVPIVFGP